MEERIPNYSQGKKAKKNMCFRNRNIGVMEKHVNAEKKKIAGMY
jgi:hypothetical protein